MDRFTSDRTGAAFASAFLVLFLAFLAAGCGTTLGIASRWADRRVEIDGNLKEWNDSTSFVEKDGIRCGIMNDEDFVYVCLMSSTPNIGRQLIMRGMTVWFDPNGGTKKLIGVRFPIGGMRGGTMMRPDERVRNPDEAGDRAPQDRRQRFDESERQALNEFEFLGPGPNDLQRVSRLQGQGVEFHMTATPERFVYEMRIPLACSSQHPYAVESYAGSAIGVGFDSSPADRQMGGERGSEGRGEVPGGVPTGGGRAGGGSGRGGRGAGGMGPGGRQQGGANVSFSIWTHVQLADKVK